MLIGLRTTCKDGVGLHQLRQVIHSTRQTNSKTGSRNLPSGPGQEIVFVIGWAFGHIITTILYIRTSHGQHIVYICVRLCVCVVCFDHILVYRYDIRSSMGLGCV